MTRWILPLVALFSLLTAPAWATTYYVATTGNNANNGTTELTPFRSIQKGIDSATQAGDIITVANGTYTVSDVTGGNQNTAIVGYIRSTNANGASGNPITLRSTNYHGAKVTVPGVNNTTNSGFYISRSNWVIEGFEITGATGGTTGIVAHHGVYLSSGSNGVIVRHNDIHDIARTLCYSVAFGNTGIFADTVSDILVEYNLIRSIGRLRDGESGCSTSIYHHDHGIYFAHTTNGTIRRNVIYDTTRGWSIHIYPGPTTNLTIANNTIAGRWVVDGQGRIDSGQIVIYNTLTGGTIKNNLSYDATTSMILVGGTIAGSGVSVTNNIQSTNDTSGDVIFTGSVPVWATSSGNLDNTSLGVIDAAGNDFRLAAGSAAIAAGTTVSGVTCNGTCDVGAFESATFSSATINNAIMDVTIGLSTNTPILPASGIATFTVACSGSNCGTPVVASAAKLTGTDSIIRLTLTGLGGSAVCEVGQTWTVTHVQSNLTDSALIGGTLSQPVLAFATQSVTNACTGGSPPADPGTPHWYFKLDDGTTGTTPTSANDESANNLDGTLTNGPQWVTGKHGNAVHFTDQGTGYIAVPHGNGVNPSTQDLTMCVGVIPDAGLETAARTFMGPRRGTNQRAYMSMTGGTYSMGVQSSFADTNLDFPIVAGWTRLCMVMDSGTATLYKNGAAGTGAQSVKSYTSFAFGSNVTLGLVDDIGASSQGGVTLDEPKLYLSALSAANVLDDYLAWEPPPPVPTGSFEQKAHQFDDVLISGGHLGVLNASVTLRADTGFSLVTQTDCTGGNCTPIGQRLHVSRNGGAFVPVQDTCQQDTVCFYGSSNDPLLFSGTVSCCLVAGLAATDGSTLFTMAAIPIYDLPNNGSITHRYMLKSGSAMVENDTFDFKLINQDASAFAPDPPSHQARVTITPLTAISAPTNLHEVGAASNTIIEVIWAPVTSVSLAGYHVYQGSAPGGPYTLVATITSATAAATHSSMTTWRTVVGAAGTYYYVVKSFDNVGGESAASSEIAVVRTGPVARTPVVR